MWKKIFWLPISILVLIAADYREDKINILNHRGYRFKNSNCKLNSSCDLKEIQYTVENYMIKFDDQDRYGTRFFAQYRTDTVKNLENYVFVQFLMGCMYSTELSTGQIKIAYPISKENFGEFEEFKYPGWVIDSRDSDPAYLSVPGLNRHANYRWNRIKNSFSDNTQVIYGKEKPNNPILYIPDRKSQSYFYKGVAYNNSLKFKTCLYKTAQVPTNTDPKNINFAKPINCFYWDSSFIYNHKKNKFKSLSKIAPACR